MQQATLSHITMPSFLASDKTKKASVSQNNEGASEQRILYVDREVHPERNRV